MSDTLQFSTAADFTVNYEACKRLVEAARAYNAARAKMEKIMNSPTAEHPLQTTPLFTEVGNRFDDLMLAVAALDSPPESAGPPLV